MLLLLVGAIWLHWPDYTDRCLGLAAKDAQELLRTNTSGWYIQDDADTVIVFVHGFMSDNVMAWCYLDERNPRKDVYFPELVRHDTRLGVNPADIFVAGYFTSLDSTEFDIDAATHTLYSDLRRQSVREKSKNVLDYDRIVFVTHSAGGVVVRRMLVRNKNVFKDKSIGLVLIASPAGGSLYAYHFAHIISLLRNSFASQLSPESGELKSLDVQFRELQGSGEITICGKELMEHRALYGIGPIEILGKVVGSDAAGEYFGEAILIEDSDHISIAKPTGLEHRTYKEFFDFYVYEFCKDT